MKHKVHITDMATTTMGPITINRVRNKLEVTLMKPASSEDYKKIMQETIAEADELLAVFNALLSVAQLEAGARDIQKEMLDVVDLIKQAVEFMDPAGEEIGVHFDLDLPEDPLFIKAARPLMSQAIINLIDNSLKYGLSDDPIISVGITTSKDTLKCSSTAIKRFTCPKESHSGISPAAKSSL